MSLFRWFLQPNVSTDGSHSLIEKVTSRDTGIKCTTCMIDLKLNPPLVSKPIYDGERLSSLILSLVAELDGLSTSTRVTLEVP